MPMDQEGESKRRLPSGGEFSPGQVELDWLLKAVRDGAGDREAIQERIRQQYFSQSAESLQDPDARLRMQGKRAGNVLISMGTYGLFDSSSAGLTSIGQALLEAKDADELHARFARHIINKRHGVDVLGAARQVLSRDGRITKETLAKALRLLGFDLPVATTHHTILMNWLALAGIVKKRGDGSIVDIDEVRMRAVTGLSLEDVNEIAALSHGQVAFLRSLWHVAQTHGEQPVSASKVIDLCIKEHGRVFKDDQISRDIIGPLAQGGWLAQSKKSSGRGGKSGQIAATEKLRSMDPERIRRTPWLGIPHDLRAHLATSLEKISTDLESDDTHKKGLALELLAVHVASDLGLTPVGFRERSAETGGAEVDLVAEAAHLHFSRWIFQCKNKPQGSVALSELAKEIGMAVLLRAQVVVMVTTGRFARSVAEHARRAHETTPLQIVLVDGDILARYRSSGESAVTDFFSREAEQTMRHKRGQLVDIDDD